jgi:hypothetical protein
MRTMVGEFTRLVFYRGDYVPADDSGPLEQEIADLAYEVGAIVLIKCNVVYM